MRARTPRVRLTALFISCSVPVVAAAQEHVPTIVNVKSVVGDKTSAKIINGKLTFWYPTVGALLYRNANTPFGSWCTATLIGCNTVLTAAHCVAEDRETKNYKVFFQHAGLFDLAGKIQMQDDKYQAPGGNGSRADVAVLTLSKSIDGIAPDHINDDREHAAELDGTIVGYGITNGNKLDYGLKRFGFVVAGACDASKTGKDLVCWNFVNNRASDTCSGDSGGPLFLSKGRPSPVVSGVTSGGNVSCQAPDNAFDASVFRNSNWIKSAVGSDLAPATLQRRRNDNQFRFVSRGTTKPMRPITRFR
jgi:secreted trypsin-like serine protease